MSYAAWFDGDDDSLNGYVTEERAEEAFVVGAWAMREKLARFLEQLGEKRSAQSIRAVWHESWGNDPGPLEGEIPHDCWSR
jgi:hypothetical protein